MESVIVIAKKSETGPLAKRIAHIDETLREQAQQKKGTEKKVPRHNVYAVSKGAAGRWSEAYLLRNMSPS